MAGKQTYGTPREFITALERRFGYRVGFDLAASAENSKAQVPSNHFDEKDDALKCDWVTLPGNPKLVFLNPPFKNIDPWAERLLTCRRLARFTVMLVPASVGTLWFVKHVQHRLYYDGIPRITFEGENDGYPKDLITIVAGYGMQGSGYWDWRAQR